MGKGDWANDWRDYAPFMPFEILLNWSIANPKWEFVRSPIYLILAFPAMIVGMLVVAPIWFVYLIGSWTFSFPRKLMAALREPPK